MKYLLPALLFLILLACQNENAVPTPAPTAAKAPVLSEIEEHFQRNNRETRPSRSVGTVDNGSLEHGRIVPFSGPNFHYFDTASYMRGRCFVHENVLKTILETYTLLEKQLPGKLFGLMECSKKKGGKIHPHITHQNGMSVDFMTPLQRDGKQCLDYDYAGAPHYFMDFDDAGRYKKDAGVSIDFETMAQHILLLEKTARANGLKISKVIFRMELKDELFASEYGKRLKTTGIYFAQKLTPLINRLHDDHFHVDFEPL